MINHRVHLQMQQHARCLLKRRPLHKTRSLRAGREQDEHRISSHVRFLLSIVELVDHILVPHAISQRWMRQQAGIEKKDAC